MIYIGSGLVVILAIGAFLLSQKKGTENVKDEVMENTPNQLQQGSAAEENAEGANEATMEGDNALNSTSPATTGTVSPTGSTSKVLDVKVEGGMYYFKPNTITVKKGEPVRITFTSAGGMHDFVIDDLNVKSDRVQTGQSTTVEFTPDKTGSFEYYCSVANHKALGMKGTLIVK